MISKKRYQHHYSEQYLSPRMADKHRKESKKPKKRKKEEKI